VRVDVDHDVGETWDLVEQGVMDVVRDRVALVHREGRRVILEPADEWSQEFRACLGSVAEDIPRPRQERLIRVRNPFD